MYARTGLLAWIAAGICANGAYAINGPGANAISNANWGTANDPFPYVARIEIDLDGNGTYNHSTNDTFCTGTLIAPEVLVTAGHCFRSFLNPGASIPANRVRVNFGQLGQINNSGGKVHPLYSNVPGPDQNDLAYVLINRTAGDFLDNALGSPVALYPTIAWDGDTNTAVGFGVGHNSGAGPAAAPAFGIWQHLGGAPGRAAGAKGWAGIRVDGLTADHVTQSIDPGEDFTEGGDSGGPGMQTRHLPRRAWASSLGAQTRSRYVMSAVDAGPTPSVVGGAFNYDTDPGTPGVQPGTDTWTRLDTQGNFLNEAMALGTTSIYHNLPLDPASMNPNDMVKVLIRASVNNLEPYTLSARLWEEDNEPGAPYHFTGDVTLGITPFNDDLAGFGFSAGIAPAGVTRVCIWDRARVGDLVPYDEAGNPGDPDLDWVFHVNYKDAGQSVAPPSYTLQEINTQIADCEARIAAGTALRGGYAMVPEPGTVLLLALGVLGMRVRRR